MLTIINRVERGGNGRGGFICRSLLTCDEPQHQSVTTTFIIVHVHILSLGFYFSNICTADGVPHRRVRREAEPQGRNALQSS